MVKAKPSPTASQAHNGLRDVPKANCLRLENQRLIRDKLTVAKDHMKPKRKLVRNFSLYIEQVVIYLICQKQFREKYK